MLDKPKIVQLHSRPILQVTYEDFEALCNFLNSEDRYLTIKSAAKLLDSSTDFVQSLEDLGLIEAHYDKKTNVTRHQKRYLYSELMSAFGKVKML